ncbi:unnamed protein product [Nippostrongylus brasiliensis]|uniref:Transposase n=1 Tax=Nippostrongylus brasiliensis TaxID=27835 RepID=A0A0N4YXQ1_NIPBR|nr:unnamed protein product [Nippostrongylus brasiliensis]
MQMVNTKNHNQWWCHVTRRKIEIRSDRLSVTELIRSLLRRNHMLSSL